MNNMFIIIENKINELVVDMEEFSKKMYRMVGLFGAREPHVFGN